MGIFIFFLEIFTLLHYANEESDDVIGGSTKTVQHSIKNISRNIGPVFFKLGTRNVHHKRNRMGAFHSTKISGNSGSKSNGTEIFRKFISKISVHLSRLSFFLEIWKFRKCPVPFGISTRYESAPVSLVVKLSYTRWRRVLLVDTTLDAKWSAIVRACSWSPILHENVRIWFPGKLWTGRSEFPVGQFARFAYSSARKVRKFLS